MFKRGRKNTDSDDDLGDLRGGFMDAANDDLDAGFLSDADEPDTEPSPSRRRRAYSTGHVGVVGGFFRVIGITLVSLIVFLLIGFGIAFGARALGAIQMVDLSRINLPLPTIEIPGLTPPTALPLTVEPTSAAGDAADAALLPTPFPTAASDVTALTPTPDEPCPQMATWWNAQAPIYETFLSRSIEQPPNPLPAALQQMQIQRDAAQSDVVAPCVEGARSAFVAGYDALLSAFMTLQGGNLNGARAMRLMAANAFADGLVAVWSKGVATPDSPAGAAAKPGGGEACGALAWYGAAKPQRDAFFNAYLSIDVGTTPPATIRQHQNTMIAALDAARDLDVPDCASAASGYLIAYLDDLNNAMQMRLGSNPAEAARMDSAFRSHILLDAWLQFMGIAP